MLKVLAVWGFLVLPDVTLTENVLLFVGDIRQVTDKTLIITSNHRSKEVNRQVGGVANSRHLCGKALDIRLKGLSTQDVNNLLKLKDNYDVVVESDHIHIEMKEGCNDL